jgi:hypothetical protein
MTTSSFRKIKLRLDQFDSLRPVLIKDVITYEVTSIEEVSIVLEVTEGLTLQKITGEELELAEKIYVVIDTVDQDTFGHWIFESAIWIPEIKRLYPTLVHKIEFSLINRKKYKEDFLLYLGVRYTYYPSPRNITIICPPFTSLTSHRYLSRYLILLDSFHRHLEEISFSPIKTNDNLLLPRQTKESLSQRDVDTRSLEEVFKSNSKEAKIFISNESTNFSDQVLIVRGSRSIFVTDGSAFLVNGFLAINSNIIVLGTTLVRTQSMLYEKVAAILDVIEKGNNVVFVNNAENKFEFESIKSFYFNEIFFRNRWNRI